MARVDRRRRAALAQSSRMTTEEGPAPAECIVSNDGGCQGPSRDRVLRSSRARAEPARASVPEERRGAAARPIASCRWPLAGMSSQSNRCVTSNSYRGSHASRSPVRSVRGREQGARGVLPRRWLRGRGPRHARRAVSPTRRRHANALPLRGLSIGSGASFPGRESTTPSTRCATSCEHIAEFDDADAKLIVMGDSAGATLLTVACALTRGEELGVAAQVVIYPTLGPELFTDSVHDVRRRPRARRRPPALRLRALSR